ncbi:MAG: RNA 3'-phosphate cyclase [Nitrospirae bacterium]|nr:MAG: RNA 3'-phosphate cyclase [Nitrospirota bacterium]
MLDIDGARYSGSGTIVRQAVAFSALTGIPIHLYHVRAKRPKPGLRRQHLRVVQAIGELVNASLTDVYEGSQDFRFVPHALNPASQYVWDIGSAGSTTMLALAVLPVLAFRSSSTVAEIHGGVFQDFAPSVFHLEHVMQPWLQAMGLRATVTLVRPGYVPTGRGVIRLEVEPVPDRLAPLIFHRSTAVQKVWGIALASHLAERRVAQRMADAANRTLVRAGHRADIEIREDTTAHQAGAALALFADCEGGIRLGADRAGAPGRRSEDIGRQVAKQLLDDLATGATLDRFAADQIIPFAALADGESRFLIPGQTDHIESNAWLAHLFLGAKVTVHGHRLNITGTGYRPFSSTGVRS